MAEDNAPGADALAAENESLRNELAAENANLQQQIAATRQQAAGGMTDDDVRRVEHPDEFTDEG